MVWCSRWTVDATSGDSAAATRAPVAFARVVVIGGGCYGRWYAGQLARAARRGALIVDDVVVVDRNPACLVAVGLRDGSFDGLPLRLDCNSWSDYLAGWLASGVDALARDALVPSPLMPHVCLDWLVARAQARWPTRAVRVAPIPRLTGLPWERGAPDGRHYVSFATWMCPVNCIEPARCPETRGPRDWSLPPALATYVAAGVGTDAPPLRGPVIFHCVHRTYGVGMIDAAPIAQADVDIAAWGTDGPLAVLVGTVSHCHGALGVLDIT